MLSSIAGPVSRAGGTMGVLPAGRGNDFARMLGLPDTPEAQARLLLEGSAKPVDLLSLTLGDAEPRLVAGSVYSGVDAIVSEIVDKVRWMPGPLQYPWAAVLGLATYKPVEAHVVVDGERHDFRAATVVVANSGFYGSGMKIAPSAAVDDGFLDVVVIEAASRRSLIRSLPKVYDGRHVELDQVHVLRGRVVEISGTPSVPMGGDGEPLGHVPTGDSPARIEILPGVLDLIRP
jgi:diacylglycerol kinase family enzyme